MNEEIKELINKRLRELDRTVKVTIEELEEAKEKVKFYESQYIECQRQIEIFTNFFLSLD